MTTQRKSSKGRLTDYAILFGAGFAWDAIISLDVIVTANFSWLLTALTTVACTLLSYLMFDRIVEESRVNWTKVCVLAVGSGVGAAVTTLAMKSLYR